MGARVEFQNQRTRCFYKGGKYKMAQIVSYALI